MNKSETGEERTDIVNEADTDTRPRRGPKPNPETRVNLLRAGVRAIHERGFHATGINDIVNDAGVPKGSFYNHFPSKEAFAAEVVDAYFDANVDGLRAILTDPDTPPLDRLRNYFDSRARRLRRHGYVRGCLLGNLSLEVSDHSDVIRARLAAHFRSWSWLFEQCIAQAQHDGTTRNPLPARVLAEFVLNGWEGALLRARAAKSNVPLRQFTEVVFTTVLA